MFTFFSFSGFETCRTSSSSEPKSSARGCRFCDTARRSCSFNAPAYPPPRPRRCSTGCSTRSLTSAPSATGSRRNSRRGCPAGCWDGAGEMVRRRAGAFALPQGSGGCSSHGHKGGLAVSARPGDHRRYGSICGSGGPATANSSWTGHPTRRTKLRWSPTAACRVWS